MPRSGRPDGLATEKKPRCPLAPSPSPGPPPTTINQQDSWCGAYTIGLSSCGRRLSLRVFAEHHGGIDGGNAS